MVDGKLTVYRGCFPVVDAEYEEGSNQTPSEVITEAVASAAGVEPIEIQPLYDFLDPDALNALFDAQNKDGNVKQVLSFKLDTWNIFVRDDGKIRVCDATQRLTEPEPVFKDSVA